MRQPTMYNAALYMRLSRDDEEYGESVSIDTQRKILRQYAHEHGFNIVDEYIDDGWSGTNFKRPSFERMIGDIEAGKVNCVITKDLSRFGREHIAMGYYLELYFPERKVRYISVTENEDTEKGLSDFVPFKNLFNEFFAKDTSRKVKTALHSKFKSGAHYCPYAPLGYRVDPEQKGHLLVNPDTRWIIEKIFDMADHGIGAHRINKALIAERVPTASWLLYQEQGLFADIYDGQPEERRYEWGVSQVKKILQDETYIGNSVHGKLASISYKNKRKVRQPEETWMRVENTHEAIIDKETFAHVQQQIASRRRERKSGDTHIFSGIVQCADCGHALQFGTNRTVNVTWNYFQCSRYRQQGKEYCSCHYIRYDTLYAYVLSRVQYWVAQAEQSEEALLNSLLAAGDKEHQRAQKKALAELKKAQKRQTELDTMFVRLYEDKVAEKISEHNFSMMSARFQQEQTEVEAKIQALTQTVDQSKQKHLDAEKWIACIKQYTSPTELTAPMLNALIEKIVVHEAVKNEDGTKEQEVEIYYRFVGKID